MKLLGQMQGAEMMVRAAGLGPAIDALNTLASSPQIGEFLTQLPALAAKVESTLGMLVAIEARLRNIEGALTNGPGQSADAVARLAFIARRDSERPAGDGDFAPDGPG